MKDIREKIRAWNNKVEKGNDKYVKIAPCGENMVYMFSGNPYPVNRIEVLVDTGEGFKLHYIYDTETGDKSDFSFGIIVKDKKAMVVDDEKLGRFAIGLDESAEDSSVKTMVVHVRTKTFHSVTMADTTGNTVMVMEEFTSLNTGASDAIAVFFSKLITQIRKNCEVSDGI